MQRSAPNGYSVEDGAATMLPEADATTIEAHGGQAQSLVKYDAEEAARIEEQLAREQAELKMIKAVLGSVFSVRKPRDVFAGTSSGLKTVARGFGVGLASLVAQPYLGAKHSGAKGFVKGVGAGVATCAASTVGGVAIGSGQIVRGVANTPGAIMHKARGKVWNSESRAWEQDWYSLEEEAKEVLKNHAASTGTDAAGDDANASGTCGGSSPSRSRRRVADRGLYDVLEVEPEASESQIRKAFYKKSLQYHPDKNPGNPEATQKFQAVSEAYRVLGDADRRKLYDEHGQDPAFAGMPKIEPMVFFAALFGSHHFETYVGRLRLAQEVDGDLQSLLRDAIASSEDDPQVGLDALKVERAHERMKVVQREREVKCAVDLAKLLSSAVDGTDEALEAWEAVQRKEAERLAQVPCGMEMLYLVGWVYANRARQFFASGVVKRVLAKVEGKMHLTQSKAKMAGTLGKTCFRINGVVKKTEKQRKNLMVKKDASRTEDDGKGGPPQASPRSATAEAADVAADEADAPPAHHRPSPAPSPTADESLAGDSAWDDIDAFAPPCADEVDDATSVPGLDAGKDAKELLPGSIVSVRGLRSSPELNDEMGVVVRHDVEKDRYLVQMVRQMQGGGLKALKKENLVLLQEPVDAEGFSGASAPGASGAATSSSPGRGSDGSAAGPSGEAKDGQWAPGGDDADMANAFKDCMPLFHDSLWSATSLDIELTLSRVVQKVLRDMSVDKSKRRRRAEVLLRLGIVFQEPMQEYRRIRKAENGKSSAQAEDGTTSDKTVRASNTSSTSNSSKRSILARFRPRATWRRSSDTKEAKDNQKEKAAEEKRKRMEGAIAMMAAGASTEDVDDMVLARAAMEAEFGEDSPFL